MNWQPIETAPNGTMILICSMVASDTSKWAFVDWVVNGGFVLHKGWSGTHWMPLPPAPAKD